MTLICPPILRPYSAENVAISGGGRSALTRVAASLGHINLGHFLPDYTAYEELLDIFKAFTAIPILLEGERGYAFTVDDLRREVTGRGLAALLISNPCNPTGKLVQGEELSRWVDLARDRVAISPTGPLKPGDGVVFDAGNPEKPEEGPASGSPGKETPLVHEKLPRIVSYKLSATPAEGSPEWCAALQRYVEAAALEQSLSSAVAEFTAKQPELKPESLPDGFDPNEIPF